MTNLATGKADGADTAAPESGLQASLVRRKLIESSVTVVVFLVIFAGFGLWLGVRFFAINGRLLDVHQNVPILLLGLAVLVTMIPGQFDLSVAGVATLTCFLTIGLTVREGWPFPAALATSLGVGVVVGLINGFLVERLKVNAFIATLGTGGICAGLSAVYSGGTLISPLPVGPQIPDWFSSFGAFSVKAPSWLIGLAIVLAGVTLFFSLDHVRPASWTVNRWRITKVVVLVVLALLLVFVFQLTVWISAVSWMIFFLLAIAGFMWVLLQYTTYGRHLQAIGSNRSAALLAGVKVQRQVLKSFVLGSLLAATSGIVLAASQGSASPDAAASFLLPAFAAAFLSTVVLSAGRFTVPGTIIGGIFVVWVGLGLVIGGLPPTWIPVVNGVVLIGAVALSTAMRLRR
jgi:ribose/xylose/arabinose/galactoside ABC-type transport system permease subunit